MSRPIRIEFPDALYQVTARGDRREDIFEDDAVRKMFLSTYVFQLADLGNSDVNDLVGAQASRLPAYVVGASAPYPQRGQEPLRGNLGVPLAGAADGASAIQWDNFLAYVMAAE